MPARNMAGGGTVSQQHRPLTRPGAICAISPRSRRDLDAISGDLARSAADFGDGES